MVEINCGSCGKKITEEAHSAMYDEPPFYCSETCYGQWGRS